MSKKIAGKIFSTPEEAGVTPPTDAELAQRTQDVRRGSGADRRLTEADHWTEVSPKFWDDTSGTEYEGWRDR